MFNSVRALQAKIFRWRPSLTPALAAGESYTIYKNGWKNSDSYLLYDRNTVLMEYVKFHHFTFGKECDSTTKIVDFYELLYKNRKVPSIQSMRFFQHMQRLNAKCSSPDHLRYIEYLNQTGAQVNQEQIDFFYWGIKQNVQYSYNSFTAYKREKEREKEQKQKFKLENLIHSILISIGGVILSKIDWELAYFCPPEQLKKSQASETEIKFNHLWMIGIDEDFVSPADLTQENK